MLLLLLLLKYIWRLVLLLENLNSLLLEYYFIFSNLIFIRLHDTAVCLSAWLSDRQSYLFIYLTIYQSVCLSTYLYLYVESNLTISVISLCFCFLIVFIFNVFLVLPSCLINEYVCASGGCVSASLRCDGHDDCLDSSDEVWLPARPSLMSDISYIRYTHTAPVWLNTLMRKYSLAISTYFILTFLSNPERDINTNVLVNR